MNTWAFFPLPHAVTSTPARVTQSLAETVVPSTAQVTITTGLFETHPHLLTRAAPQEPAWKQEQRRLPRRR